MWPYWMMFLLPALFALVTGRHRENRMTGLRSVKLDIAWLATALVMSVLIGFRLQVGGDWANYFNYLSLVENMELAEVLKMSDPGYLLLNWVSVRMDWGVFGVNLISGTIFSIGLAVFCRSLPRPWLALAVAIPYMVIVVSMGYTRQGIALGLAMLGLVALERKATLWFVIWVVLGATFHKTAVLLLPIAALATTKNRYWTVAWVGVVTLGAFALLLQESVDTLYAGYIEAEYQSEGTLVRLLMNALPAVLILLWRHRFRFAETEAALWQWFAIISLALLALLLLSPSSTAVDRVGLYMLPLQLVVFAHFPDVVGRRGRRNSGLVAALLVYYAGVQFVWLNYASHAYAWVPYRFYLLEDLL
jgi:hypothetical protein